MISIDRVYKTILFYVNSDIRGNVTPQDIRLAIHDVVNEIYEEYLFEVNRLVNRENKGLVNGALENLADRVREKILYFLKEDIQLNYAAPYFSLPADLRYFDSIYYDEENEFEPCKSNSEFKLKSNLADALPSTRYPISLQVGNKIKVAPKTIKDKVTVSYLRNPLVANWAYVVYNNAELVNPGAPDFQNIDLHPGEESNVILKALMKMGINLKEQDIQAITQNQENKDFNQENAI